MSHSSNAEDCSDRTEEIREAIKAAIYDYFERMGVDGSPLYIGLKSGTAYLSLGPSWCLESDSKYGAEPPYGMFIDVYTVNTQLTEKQITALINLGLERRSHSDKPDRFWKEWLQPDEVETVADLCGNYIELVVATLVDVYEVRNIEELLIDPDDDEEEKHWAGVNKSFKS